jgi:hypothetical protein
MTRRSVKLSTTISLFHELSRRFVYLKKVASLFSYSLMHGCIPRRAPSPVVFRTGKAGAGKAADRLPPAGITLRQMPALRGWPAWARVRGSAPGANLTLGSSWSSHLWVSGKPHGKAETGATGSTQILFSPGFIVLGFIGSYGFRESYTEFLKHNLV